MKHIMNLIRNSAIYIVITNLVDVYRAAKHRHDWAYSSHEEEIAFGNGSQVTLNQRHRIKLNFKTRYCNKCGLKEKMHPKGNWYPCSLTKEEQRDKKLKDLGI